MWESSWLFHGWGKQGSKSIEDKAPRRTAGWDGNLGCLAGPSVLCAQVWWAFLLKVVEKHRLPSVVVSITHRGSHAKRPHTLRVVSHHLYSSLSYNTVKETPLVSLSSVEPAWGFGRLSRTPPAVLNPWRCIPYLKKSKTHFLNWSIPEKLWKTCVLV